jgi:glucose/arabinose dehydrogenase
MQNFTRTVDTKHTNVASQLKNQPRSKFQFRLEVAAMVAILMLTFIFQARSQTLPAGFSQVQVATGISNPTIMIPSPDGRIFIAQQSGALRVFKNGSLLSTPFVTLSVSSSGERGLLGIAFDPAFATNQYIYLYYTVSSGANNRISRFTANGDVVVPGSEVVILNLDPLSSATNHNGGTMQFGPDGKLYVGVGENANSAHAQNLDTYHGKILRINSDGTPAAGNPFTTGSVQRRSVWAYGMRNPYTLTFQPGTGKLFVNDVGQNTWEEINNCTAGGLNYGWPGAEGASTNPAYTNPVYSYQHGSGSGQGCAITGGTFFNPATSNYPALYTGNYFYIDFCSNWIDRLTITGTTVTRSNFATNIAGSPVGIITGPDGNLYFLSRSNSSLNRISYTSSTAPVITAQPQSVTVAQGNPASFSVSATGSAPLSYQWRKNGVNISGAVSSTYSISSTATGDAGTYSVVVTNAVGSSTSNNATLTVTSANTPPVATIVTPASGAMYSAGTTVSYSGTGFDTQNGTLGASAFQWYVMFHHDTHNHPGPTAPDGVTSGSFSIPNTGETAANVFYRLYLVVTDLQGARDTAFTDILPNTSTITINTSPQGMPVTLDGQPFNAPITVTSVEGMLRTIGATSPVTINNALTYNFTSWTQGGTQSQTITTPVSNVSYTANYTAALRTPENPSATVNGLNYSYYHGTWSVLPVFTSLTPVATGTVSGFDISPRTQNDNFGFRHTGYISIPVSGVYTFYTSSDDGSKLYIGTTLVVNNDGLHGNQEASGQIGLLAGKHAITVDFFENGGAEILTVSYQSSGIAKQVIPNTALFRQSQSVTLNPVADAYVRSGSFAGINYGTAGQLITKTSTSANATFETYLRFDISSFTTAVGVAKLRLYGRINNTVAASVPVAVYNVASNTWSETTINFTNKPVSGTTALASTTVAGTVFQYYEWDITQQVAALKAAGINFISLKVRNTTVTLNSRINFNSREAAANRPQLVISSGSPRIEAPEPEIQNTGAIIIASNEINVYPQPANEQISLEFPEEFRNGTVVITDIKGNQVMTLTLSDETKQQIPVSNLKTGMYVVNVFNQETVIRKKIIISR